MTYDNWQHHRMVAEYNNGRKMYVVEPRHPDGSLDVKRIDGEFGSKYPASGITERKVFRYYFLAHPKARGASAAEVWEWYRAQGLCVRIKTW